jgi:DNA-binding NarL/FixJ family response regulator
MGAVGIVVVDDDAMVRSWLRLSLRATEFSVAGEASSTVDAMELVISVEPEPELMLVDYYLPDHPGTELIRELRHRHVLVPTVLMTANEELGFNELARSAGAQGTLLKTGDPLELLDVLRLVLAGRQAFDRRHPRRETGQAVLSPREREVLGLVAEGATNAAIARELGIGVESVKTLLGRTFSKLGVQRRAQAVAAAHDRGLL